MSPYRPHNVARAFGTHWGLDLPEGCGLRPHRSGKSLLYSVWGTEGEGILEMSELWLPQWHCPLILAEGAGSAEWIFYLGLWLAYG